MYVCMYIYIYYNHSVEVNLPFVYPWTHNSPQLNLLLNFWATRAFWWCETAPHGKPHISGASRAMLGRAGPCWAMLGRFPDLF